MYNNKPALKDEKHCTGCGVCILSCPNGAILKKSVGFGTWIPEIDEKKCIGCGKCEAICNRSEKREKIPHRSYIAYNLDRSIRLKSASGGVFSALATYILDLGGSVFGAELRFEQGKAVVEHTLVTKVSELPRLLGSKYVQSNCVQAYQEVLEELKRNRLVLFSGCSCQIAGLKKYLGNVNQDNLFTLDLICHGVPGIDFLNEYIDYLSKRYRGELCGFSFRVKEEYQIKYMIHATLNPNRQKRAWNNKCTWHGGDGKQRTIRIPLDRSGYYRMFLSQESYREACYQCEYATLDKPADLSVGDYFEVAEDYPELVAGDNAIDTSSGLSCVITNTGKGEKLLSKVTDYLFLKEVDTLVVQASHNNLNHPSKHSPEREKLLKEYKKKGYLAIEKHYFKRYIRIRAVHTLKMLLLSRKRKLSGS